MVGETYRRVKADFWFIFFVIVATNLSLNIHSIVIIRTIRWEELVGLIFQHTIAVFISMSVILYLFKGFSNRDWNPLSW